MAGLFECPICFEEFVPPIYQCFNGHILCKDCIENVDKCPICREDMPPRKIRNLEIERRLREEEERSLGQFACKYRSNGCKDKTKHEPIDCAFVVANFCGYVGFKDCKELVGKQEFAVHLMEKHGIAGEFTELGEAIDIQQIGGSLQDIDNTRVMWGPSFIVHGEYTLFVMTHVRPKNVSWAVFILGSETLARQFSSTIAISQSSDTQGGESLKWSGRVCSIAAGWKDHASFFNLYTEQLKDFCNTSGNSFGWNVQVKISKRWTNPTPPRSTQGNYQIKSSAYVSFAPSAPLGSESSDDPPLDPQMSHGLSGRTSLSPAGPESLSTSSRDESCRNCGNHPKTSKFIYKCLECENFNGCFCTVEKSHKHHVLLISALQYKTDFARIVHSLRREGLEGRVTQDLSGVHSRVQCDGCKTTPVFGLRYKCAVCADYDCCHNCAKKATHKHNIFLVIASPNTGERLRSAFKKIQQKLKNTQQ